MSDEILTALEVATLLKVADKTAYTMTQKCKIPAFKVSGQWRLGGSTSTPGSKPRPPRHADRGTAMRSPANTLLAGRAPSFLSCAEAAPCFGDV